MVSYHHGNSSSDVDAIWLGEGEPPEPRPSAPLKGWPALVSTAPIPIGRIVFAPNNRLTVTVRSPVNVSNDTGHCYFDADETGAICLDGSGIVVKVAP